MHKISSYPLICKKPPKGGFLFGNRGKVNSILKRVVIKVWSDKNKEILPIYLYNLFIWVKMFLMEHFILHLFSDRGWECLFNKFGYGYLMYRKYKEIKDWPWYNKLICKLICDRTSYINKMFLQSLSQLTLTALFTKESLAIRLV